MKKVLSTLLLMVIMIAGCAQNEDPKIVQKNSGSRIISNFSEYNQYAQENDKPIVDFVKLTLSKPNKRNIIKNDKTVKSDNKKIYFYSKWRNLKSGDTCELKLYQPDGKLFSQKYSKYSFSSGKWTIHKTFLVKNYNMPEFRGKWKYELYIKGKKVTTNDFILHNDKKIEPKLDLG